MSKIRLSKTKFKKAFVWGITFVVSAFLLFLGNRIASAKLDIFDEGGAHTAKAVVSEMGEMVEESVSEELSYSNYNQYFYAEVIAGAHKGESLLAVQTSDNYLMASSEEKPVAVGDRVILYNYGIMEGDAEWVFAGYARFEPVMWLGVVFLGLLLLFGGIKGLNTIVSMSFTVLAVFAVFVPSVLAGFNIYLMTVLICIFTIVMTLLITEGATAKGLTTIMGCSFGVLLAAILELLMDRIMLLTGIIDEHSIYLQFLSSGVEINLKALIFAMVVIGAMGAVMDVAMDISSSLSELHRHAPHLSFADLVKSGLTIGKDIMGTMANTLVLAYIGSSLCSILLLVTYSSSLMELLNRENIAVEIMQALVGSLAILLTIPITSIVCGIMYTAKRRGGAGEKPSMEKTDVRKTEEEYKSILPDERTIFYYDGSTKA